MVSPLAGAWEVVSDTEQGVFVLTDTHYSGVVMSRERKKSENNEPSSEEAVQALRDVSALAGTYQVSGNMVNFHRMANLHPGHIGQDTQVEFAIDGDKMTWRVSGGVTRSGVGRQVEFRKVG